MNRDFPENLESTRKLLAGSLHLHATEQAPGVPADLLTDLARRFNSNSEIPIRTQSRSWFTAVRSFVARPAFGMAALAVAILGISIPRMFDFSPTPSGGGVRGAITKSAEPHRIRIILVQSPAGFQQALDRVGDFESSMISTASGSDGITGPRILVDFVASTISAVNASNEKVHTAPLPKDAEEISAAIATAITRL